MMLSIKNRLIVVAAVVLLPLMSATGDALYDELWRQQFHFSPPQQWMNDPNGMVYYKGEYHLFYQHNPDANVWGPMHWGHAVSRDLLHWQHLPVALYPDEKGTIFSGSAVVDWRNTSGFGSADNPPLVALFTYHDQPAEKQGRDDFQSQALAYSLDNGRTWIKYAHNPVLENPGEKAFRDPKVFWHEVSGRWIMVLAVGDHIRFYSSPDLKTWRFESRFGAGLGSHEGVWECPDLIELPVENGSGSRHVLLVSVIDGGHNGGTATQYFVGNFDGKRFHLDPQEAKRAASEPLWLDYGTDNYAGVTWSGIPPQDGRTIFIGWMSNWDYALKVPTERWRSAMTLPRSLSLHATPGGFRVHSMPVVEVESLYRHSASVENLAVDDAVDLHSPLALSPGSHDLSMALAMNDASTFSLTWSNELDEILSFTIDTVNRQYVLDRSKSGNVGFAEGFGSRLVAPIPGKPEVINVRVLVDRSSIEIFINEGETVITALVFPNQAYDALRAASDGGAVIRSATAHGLRSVWSAATE